MTHSSFTQESLICPTCKRPIPITNHYAYDSSFGNPQKKLRLITCLGAAEGFLAMTFWIHYKMQVGTDLPETLLIPIQSIVLFNLPMILHSQFDVLTAMNHVCYKNAIQVGYFIYTFFLKRSWFHAFSIQNHVNMLIFLGFAQIIFFALQILESRFGHNRPIVEPLTPFVVGFDTIYADKLDFVETSTNTMKEPRRSPRLSSQTH